MLYAVYFVEKYYHNNDIQLQIYVWYNQHNCEEMNWLENKASINTASLCWTIILYLVISIIHNNLFSQSLCHFFSSQGNNVIREKSRNQSLHPSFKIIWVQRCCPLTEGSTGRRRKILFSSTTWSVSLMRRWPLTYLYDLCS